MDVIRVGGLELRFLQTRVGTDGSLDLFIMSCEPRARVPVPHYHENWDETVFGLSGVMRWTVNGQESDLLPGQSLFIRRGVVHGFRNDTQETATVLSVLTPGILGPGYFREMAALIERGAPDPAEMEATMRRHGLVPAPTPVRD